MRNWKWTRLGKGIGDAPFEGRFGHSTILYMNSFVIFGGERRYNPDLHLRECYNDTLFFDPSSTKWTFFKTYGHMIEPRRNHTCSLIGKYMFIIGGLDSHGKMLDDIAVLNL